MNSDRAKCSRPRGKSEGSPSDAELHEFAGAVAEVIRSFGSFEKHCICGGTATVQQCSALQRLLDGDQEVSSIARYTGVSPSAMTRLLDGLERRGWVERIRTDEDRGRVLITLTANGRAEAQRLRTAFLHSMKDVLERIPRGERRRTTAALEVLRRALE